MARPGASMAASRQAGAALQCARFQFRGLPKATGTLVGERGVNLPGGERSGVVSVRVRCLADCAVLILDDATSSLDSESELPLIRIAGGSSYYVTSTSYAFSRLFRSSCLWPLPSSVVFFDPRSLLFASPGAVTRPYQTFFSNLT